MKNSIVSLAIRDLTKLGESASAGAKAIGREVGLSQNKPNLIDDDYHVADDAVLAYEKEVANRVEKVSAFEDALATARKWCFRAKERLKPFLGDTHNNLWRPTGFTTSLRVPEDYGGLLALTKKLGKHLAEHREQANEKPKVNVTTERADELQGALRAAKADLDAHDTLISDKLKEQQKALQALRVRLRGLCGELKQVLEPDDQRWHRFGLNAPAEPETPDQPEGVQVNNTTPGRLLVSCAAAPFAERYRFFVQKAGTTGEPAAVGSSSEPLFVIENLEAGARYHVFVSAVNLAGNEGSRSKAVAAEVVAKAACEPGSPIVNLYTAPKRRWRRAYSSSASKSCALRKSGQRVDVTTSSV